MSAKTDISMLDKINQLLLYDDDIMLFNHNLLIDFLF